MIKEGRGEKEEEAKREQKVKMRKEEVN